MRALMPRAALAPLVRHASPGNGYDIRTMRELLGHREVKITMIYTRVLHRGGSGIYAAMDCLRAGWTE
jgi:site-specific recombinase XerC